MDDTLYSIYDDFYLEDLRPDIAELFESDPELWECIEEVQSALYYHKALGNTAADAHPGNLGVKYVAGEPVLALFDQMNLGMENLLKGQYTLSEHLQPDVVEKVPIFDARLVRKSICEQEITRKSSPNPSIRVSQM